MKRREIFGGMFGMFLILFLLATLTVAAETDSVRQVKMPVKMFDAMNQGLIDVVLTQHSSLDATITYKNKGTEPIEIILPASFGGKALAQFGGFGQGGGNNNNNNNNNGGGQNVGGGNNNNNNNNRGGGGGGRGGGGNWNVVPDREETLALLPRSIVRQQVKTVCLEHGKREPHQGMRYKIVPIEQVTDCEEVQALCSLLGNEDANQAAIQAAAWHLNCNMSWEELEKKTSRPTRRNPQTQRWFNGDQITSAQNIVTRAERYIRLQNGKDSPENPNEYESRGNNN